MEVSTSRTIPTPSPEHPGPVAPRRLEEAFATASSTEQAQADQFRIGAIATALIAAAWAALNVWALDPSSVADGTASAGSLAMRAMVGSALIGLAAYLRRQSLEHRSLATTWKTIELQLATLDLYCSKMSPERGEAVRMSLARQLFRGPVLIHPVDNVKTIESSGAVLPDCVSDAPSRS